MHPSPPETRASLILRLRDAADMAAWDEFTEIYAPVVFRLAQRRGFQSADADDLVHDVAEQLGQSVGSIYIARTRVMKRLRQLVTQYEEIGQNEM